MDVKPMSRAAKLLEHWQGGVIVVAVALLVCLIAVPRPNLSDEIPFPRTNQRALAELSDLDARRAQELARERPDFDVRALGEAVRLYGAVDADRDAERSPSRIAQIGRALPAALAKGPEPLLKLRAYQMSVFLKQLEWYAATGEETADLRELGGGVVALLQRAQWLKPEGKGYRVVPDRILLEILFRKRWNEITDLKAPPFALSLEEQRALYAFLLAHPIIPPQALGTPQRCRSANDYLLRKVNELAEIDREYPADLARGILLLRLGRPKEAIERLSEHLDRHPEGPFTLRARNTLREAQERMLLLIN